MIVCRRFFVAGRVQGVFFRASTTREAERLGLRGWARNLPDGRVEVLALGAAPQVDDLAQFLWRGPVRARVESVVARDESTEEFAGLAGFQTG